jgi:hypothetical protein
MIRSYAPVLRAAAARPRSADRDVERAIRRWQLDSRTVGGWMGFDRQPFVQGVYRDYPAAQELAQTCSSHRPEYQEQARELFEGAEPEDRQRLGDYFLGKLALEELSCRLSGAGAGLCDKRAAFIKIWEIAQDYGVGSRE